MKKKTLSFQLTIIITLLVAFSVIVSWLLNTTLLERYYTHDKTTKLLEAYEIINQAELEDILSSSSFDVEFERLCVKGNFNIMVVSPTDGIVRANVNSAALFQMQLTELQNGQTDKEATVIKQTDQYVIEKQTDSRMESEYLLLIGYLTDGSLIFMRTAMESVTETAALTTRFFAIIAAVSLLLSIIIIAFASRSISRPIKELSKLSERMTNLDFEAHYQPRRGDSREIDELGSHMNNMSEALEKTIGELKTANNELLTDIQKKEEVDEMRKEFISNVSHELKTPLALISGYAEGLKECVNDDAESRDFYCDVIMDESEKMNRMVKQLIQLNQLEFGFDTVEMSRFDLAELVQGVVEREKLLADQEGAHIHFESQPQIIWADAFKTEQVVTNYLTNAIHHADGEKQITITISDRGSLCHLSVFNTGKPIPEEEQDKIWIKFYKVDKARTREYGGSGIGLSIVKAIMDSLHRECGVENHADGVEFWANFDK